MMTRMLLKAFVLGTVVAGFVCTAVGQDARVLSAAGDKYLISAKAGGVNCVEGRVVVARNEGRSGQLLKRDEIEIGDRVSTGSDGRAEILLNPGSYMRIDKDTEFSFTSTSLEDLKIKMYSGSAIFEVIADSDFRVSVGMPKAHVDLARSGVYRIDVSKDGTAKLTVWKGAAVAGNEKAEVKAGRTVTIDGGSAVVAKFDKDDKDGLDTWSRDRAKELAKVNASLERRSLRDTLVNSFNGRGWNMYNSFGLWIFDPRRSFYCFMPFGYGWGSPYGFDYAWDIWGLGMPRYIYFQPPPRGNTHPGGNSPVAGGQVKNPALAPPNNGDTHGRIRPPYTKIEANERGGVSGGVVRGGSNVRGGGGDIGGPIFGPPTSGGGGGGGRIVTPSAKDPAPTAPAPTIQLPIGGGGGKGKP